jgi:aspartate kinase
LGILVQKYGGTSLSSPKKIKNVAKQILERQKTGVSIVVVVSAVGDTTDRLVQLAYEITDDPHQREVDMLLSTGEQVSSALLSMAIQDRGGKAISLTGFQSGIITDNQHSRAKIKKIKVNRILKLLDESHVVIIAGFQGIGSGAEITTLGRGGSDTTGTALAAALQAERCEIYTDVDGVYTANPSIIPGAVKLDYISYEEMLELAGSGTGVLHPRSVEIAMKFGIPVIVRSAHNPGIGTTVIEGKMLEQATITGVTADKDVAKITIHHVPDSPGMAGNVFGTISRSEINIRLIIQGVSDGKYSDITMLVSRSDIKKMVRILEELAPKIKAERVTSVSDMAEVSIVGSGIASTSGVAAKMFSTLAKNKINIDLISSSHIRVACVISKKQADTAVRELHKVFKLEKLNRRML